MDRQDIESFRKYGLILIALFILVFLVVILARSARESTIDPHLGYEHMIGLGYHLTVQSIDPDDHNAQLAIEPLFHELFSVNFVSKPGAPNCDYLPPLDEPAKDHCSFSFGPLLVKDLSTDFQIFGINYDLPFHAYINAADTGPMEPSPPAEGVVVFQILGDPSKYPFDQYLLIGAVGEKVLLDNNGRSLPSVPVQEGAISYSFAVPGYTFRPATAIDLARWSAKYANPRPDWLGHPLKMSDPATWKRHRFALIIGRPSFTGNLAILIMITALIASVAVVLTSTRTNVGGLVAAHFLFLWALRAVVASAAPKTPNYVDYATLLIYVLTIVSLLLRFAFEKKEKAPNFSSTTNA